MSEAERAPGRDPDGQLRPWEKPGNVRRDCEPHRSHLLAALGLFALVCGMAAFFVSLSAILAVPLGWVVAAKAEHDLHQMRIGIMDPEGRRLTVLAGLWGRVGYFTGVLFCWVPWVVYWYLR